MIAFYFVPGILSSDARFGVFTPFFFTSYYVASDCFSRLLLFALSIYIYMYHTYGKSTWRVLSVAQYVAQYVSTYPNILKYRLGLFIFEVTLSSEEDLLIVIKSTVGSR